MPLSGTDDGINGDDMVAGVGGGPPLRYATPLNDVVRVGGWMACSRRGGGGRGGSVGRAECVPLSTAAEAVVGVGGGRVSDELAVPLS